MINFLAKYFLFLAYLLPYPLQVFTLGQRSGLFGALILISFCILLFVVLFAPSRLMVKRDAAVILILFFILSASYAISYIGNPDEYYAATLYKTVVLYVYLCVMMHPRCLDVFVLTNSIAQYKIYCPGVKMSFVLYGGPMVVMLVAAIGNSLGAIPHDAILNSKYFYGPFIRAGAGYVDPNALGIMVILVSAIYFDHIAINRLSILFFGIILLVVTAITFSRTAQILLATYFLTKYRKFFRKIDLGLMLVILSCVVIYLFVNNPDVITVFFERYWNEEGESSTGDRANQILVFLNILSSATPAQFIYGFGGQDSFQKLAGSAMHSAPLSIFIDTGLVAFLAVLVFFAISLKKALSSDSWAFRIVAMAACFVLPYIPELFFLLCVYLIIDDRKGKLMLSGVLR